MAKTKDIYINAELDWAEEQLSSWKAYIDAHPLHNMTDRTETRVTARGASTILIASIEAQGKFIQETMKNYLALLEIVDNLRNKEESKIQPRGNVKLSVQAEQYLKKRDGSK